LQHGWGSPKTSNSHASYCVTAFYCDAAVSAKYRPCGFSVTSKSFGPHLRFSHLGGHMLALFSFAFVSFASLPSCPDNSISDPPIPGVLQGKGSGQGHILLAMVRHGKMPSPTMQSHQCSLTTACTPPSARRHPTTTRIYAMDRYHPSRPRWLQRRDRPRP
jgi:hypothetical protein